MPLWMRTEQHNFCPHAQLAETKQVQPAAAKSSQCHTTARDLQVQEEALTGATKELSGLAGSQPAHSGP